MSWSRRHPDEYSALREGVVAAFPYALGMVPWGAVTGVAMVSAGFTPVQAVVMSLSVFAGSAQLAVLPLFVAEAPLWVMIATGLLVNLRYFIYSAVLAPHFSRLGTGWRILLSYITVDGMFAMFAGRYRPGDDVPHKHWFYIGGSVLVWSVWQVASIAGIFGGRLVPASWSLDYAATLALIALLIPLLFDRAVVLATVAAGIASLAGARLPLNLGVVVAVMAGITVGLIAATFDTRSRAREA